MAKPKPTLNQADIHLLSRIFLTKKEAKKLTTISILETKLKQNRGEIVEIIFKYIDENFVTKQDFEELKQQINHLPTKEEFFSRMDKISQDYQTFTQERAAILSRLDDVLAAKTN